jgi:hypothetical protein
MLAPAVTLGCGAEAMDWPAEQQMMDVVWIGMLVALLAIPAILLIAILRFSILQYIRRGQ